VNIVHVGVGPISQSDIDLAQACGACIVGFNVKSSPTSLSQAASRASIKVLTSKLMLLFNHIAVLVKILTRELWFYLDISVWCCCR
jgi:translation initiation factor IF-2